MSRGLLVRLALTLLVAAGCLLWVLWGLDLGELASEVARVPALSVLAALAALAGAFVLRVVRFQLLLGEHRPSFGRQFVASGIGFMALNVVPLRLGELVRPLYLERDGVSWGTCIGAIALERIADLLALIVMLALCAWVVEVPGTVMMGGVDVLAAGQQAAGVLVLVLAGGLTAVAFAAGAVEHWLRALPVVGDRAADFALRFRDALADLLARPGTAALVLLTTIPIWAGSVAAVAILLNAFDGLPTGPGSALFVSTLTMAGALAVPTPGGFGPFEAFCQASLALWEVEPVTATAFAGVWHLHIFGFHTVLGAALVALEGVSLAGLVREGMARG